MKYLPFLLLLASCAALGSDAPVDLEAAQTAVDTISQGAGAIGTVLGGPLVGTLATSVAAILGARYLKTKLAQPKA